MNVIYRKRLKILYIVEAFSGGIYTYLKNLSNRLVETFDIYIAYGIRAGLPKNFKKQFDIRIHFIEVKNFTRSINMKKDIQAFFEIRKIIAEIKPEIVHLHSSKAGVLGRFAVNGRKTKMFYTPHGYSFLMTDESRLKRKLYYAIEWISARHRCTTISCGPGEHRFTLKLTKNAVCINNGIDVEELDKYIDKAKESDREKSRVPLRKSRLKIYTVGRICRQKNPELFNKIAEALPQYDFLWIGEGDKRDCLKADNITVTGWLTRQELVQQALEADIFILTSSWEGLPYSLLEAMYMGKPCIVSDVSGNNDVIENQVNGFLCKNKTDFINTLVHVKSKSDIKKIAKTAHKSVANQYNIKIMAEKYKCVYLKRSVLNYKSANAK